MEQYVSERLKLIFASLSFHSYTFVDAVLTTFVSKKWYIALFVGLVHTTFHQLKQRFVRLIVLIYHISCKLI